MRPHACLDSRSIADDTAVKGNSHLFALPALISLKHMPDQLFLIQGPTYIRSTSNTAFGRRILASFDLSEYVAASVFAVSSLSIAFSRMERFISSCVVLSFVENLDMTPQSPAAASTGL